MRGRGGFLGWLGVRGLAGSRRGMTLRRAAVTILVATLVLPLAASPALAGGPATGGKGKGHGAKAPVTQAGSGGGVVVQSGPTTYYVSDGAGCGANPVDVTTGDYSLFNNAEAVQAAVNLAATDGSTGPVTIHLCAGTYSFDSTVTLTNGDGDTLVRIEGDGTAATVIEPGIFGGERFFSVPSANAVDTVFADR